MIILRNYVDSDIEGTGHLTIRVIAQHRLSRDSLIGELLSPIKISPELGFPKSRIYLLEHLSIFSNHDDLTGFSEQALVRKSKNNQRAGTVSFMLERISYSDTMESMRTQIQLASTRASKLETRTKSEDVSGVLSQADKITKESDSINSVWEPLLDNIQVVVNIGNELAEVLFSLVPFFGLILFSFACRFIHMQKWCGRYSHLY
jgi:hypothetical protein